VNWLGLRTLYAREVRRFWKVGMQTVAAPGGHHALVHDGLRGRDAGRAARRSATCRSPSSWRPGLVMMAILNNAFANASSSLIQAKLMGTRPDFPHPARCRRRSRRRASRWARPHAGVVVGAVTAAVVFLFAAGDVVDPGPSSIRRGGSFMMGFAA
jgi:ABC-2 type transport system permease protein